MELICRGDYQGYINLENRTNGFKKCKICDTNFSLIDIILEMYIYFYVRQQKYFELKIDFQVT